MDPVRREMARVVPVSGDGRCLLLLEQDPARPGELYWGTVGGGVDAGESHAEAAARELHEETGVVVGPDELVGPFLHRACSYTWNGVAYAGDAAVFTVRLARDIEISFDRLEPVEVGNVLEARWLTPEEAAADGRLAWPDTPDVMTLALATLNTLGTAVDGGGAR